VKVVGSTRWGDLASLANAHEIIGEKCQLVEENFTFAGQHRVRLYRFKKNVHFKIPEGTTLDIAAVVPGQVPPRRQG
jgi:hypothetical protein